VTRYIDHLQDAAWIEALIAEYGVAAVLRTCAQVLGERDPDEVHEVATLLRDLGIRGIVSDELVGKVRKLMPAGVLPALRRLLRAPVLRLRMAAIYTLGKLSFPAEAKALRDVFPAYAARDPICLARLLFELAWLGDSRGVRARVERIIAHESYLVRWSALGYLDCSGTPSGAGLREKAAWLRALAADPAPLVAGEARYQLAVLELEVAGRKAEWSPKAAWRKRRGALERAEPITFATLELRFLDRVARAAAADYALDELDAFARGITAGARRDDPLK
jgi:hypothetical protein